MEPAQYVAAVSGLVKYTAVHWSSVQLFKLAFDFCEVVPLVHYLLLFPVFRET